MSTVLARLAAAEAELAAAKRAVAEAHCSEAGHDWQHIGGRNCGCTDGGCSFPVMQCSKCGDCDYGDNAEGRETASRCAARRNEEYSKVPLDPDIPF
ncbi:hypothetical protein ACD578_05210 [Microvirga sp. RSM25]|uniref:hypothetical protein n=1 Tax=Microvirga sp. RSM25 TaxID=3273802 RepID=UPI00384CF371